MKRVLLQLTVWACCALMLVGLVGCTSTGKEVQPITSGFTCLAEISYRELELGGQLTRYDDGKMVLTFAEPSSLSGLSVGWNGKDMTMELGGMSIAISEDKVPQSALVKGLLHVLSAEAADGVPEDDEYIFTGTVDGMDYILSCDAATGLPRSLSMPDNELQARFSQVRALTEE